MTKRRCVPSQMRSRSSSATAENVSFRPSTSSSRTRATTSIPGGVAASWLRSTCVPSDISPSSRWGAMASMQAHSTRPTMKPVANTSGISRKLSDSG